MIEVSIEETNKCFKEVYESISNHWKEMNKVFQVLKVEVELIKKILPFPNEKWRTSGLGGKGMVDDLKEGGETAVGCKIN